MFCFESSEVVGQSTRLSQEFGELDLLRGSLHKDSLCLLNNSLRTHRFLKSVCDRNRTIISSGLGTIQGDIEGPCSSGSLFCVLVWLETTVIPSDYDARRPFSDLYPPLRLLTYVVIGKTSRLKKSRQTFRQCTKQDFFKDVRTRDSYSFLPTKRVN